MKVPTERDIKSLEQRLAEMRDARKAAKNEVLQAMKSDEFFDMLESNELLSIMRRIQKRLLGNHKRNRGSPVPDTLKEALIDTLKQGDKAPSLSAMADMFNLSVSYISRIKKELKDSGKLEPVRNAYSDDPEFKLPEHAVAHN
jgi:DNA-binding GntR family transcriptional regulator